jgi:hypothetical protein
MAGDKRSRRFIRLWWTLAFTAGAVAGTVSITLLGLQDTIWWIVGVCGSVIAVTAIFEGYGNGAGMQRTAKHRWLPSQSAGQHQGGRKQGKSRGTVPRGRLRAINGRKIADPPAGEES